MPIQELPEHLAGLWQVSSEEGGEIFEAVVEILGEACSVKRRHVGQPVDLREFL